MEDYSGHNRADTPQGRDGIRDVRHAGLVALKNIPVACSVTALCFGDALVDRLPAGVAFVDAVPVGDGFLAQLPAEKNRPSINFAGKIEQTDIEILHLHSDGVDFRYRIFHALQGFFTLGFATGEVNDIQKSSAIKKHAVGNGLEFCIHRLDKIFSFNGRADQRFQYGKKRLRFGESESTFGHGESILFQAVAQRYMSAPTCSPPKAISQSAPDMHHSS